MITINDLQFNYADHRFQLAIQNWQVNQGQHVAIVGPSGSGKTTLLHLLAGILRPQTGRIQVGNCEVSSASDAERRDFRATQIGLVFQQFELIDYLNVRDNIYLPFRINRRLQIDAPTHQRFQELVERTGIAHLQRQSVRQLSQGERQRVAICRALITEPKWILADEPTGNLDPENKTLIVDLLQQQASRAEATLLMVTHDTSLVSSFPDVVDFQQWRALSRNEVEAETRV